MAEKLVLNLLRSAKIEALPNASKKRTEQSQWDIEAFRRGRRFTIECKYDIYQAESGNIAVEYYNPRQAKPSGIGVTTADLWVFVLTKPVTAWVTTVSQLRAYVATMPPFRDIACGGDGNAAMKLYPSDEILGAIFTRIDNLSPAQLPLILANLLEAPHGSQKLAKAV